MLTERELDILERRAKGESQQAIAHALHISQAAVSKFERNAKRKILDAKELLDLTATMGITLDDSRLGTRVEYGGRK